MAHESLIKECHLVVIFRTKPKPGLNFLERSGKTGFFRSGPEPLILDDGQRSQRRKKRIEDFSRNRDLSGRGIFLAPQLAHAGNFAPPQDDSTSGFIS